MCTRLLTALLFALTCNGLTGADEPPEVELIPRKTLFARPERIEVRISPDGYRYSFLAPHRGVRNIWVGTVGVDNATPVTAVDRRSIRQHFWAANGDQIIYRHADGADGSRVFSIDLESAQVVDLTPVPGVDARIVAIDRDHADEVLVSMNDRAPEMNDVWRVNTRTGERELVFANDDGLRGLQADSTFRVRLGARPNGDGGLGIVTRDGDDEPWYEIARWDIDEAQTSRSLGLSRDGDTAYLVDSGDSDTSALYACTIGGGPDAVSRIQLAVDQRVDAADVTFDPETGRPQAVAFDYLRREWRLLVADDGGVWAYLQSLADGELAIVDRDRADRRWIVSYTHDDRPRTYYVFDRAQRQATKLFSDRPALERAPLVAMEPIVIRARDGLRMVSYLTLPAGHAQAHAGARPDDALPMVLYVHGGPWARDKWGYEPVHQWLANRGYAVLSVNYRGSRGFGTSFQDAGNGEWAGRMQDDLIDAVIWAVDQGIAHPDKVAIMGGSYGGYATLVGLTFTPEFFAAGVDIVGPSNLQTLLRSVPEHWAPVRAMFEERIGALSEPEFLDLISPIHRANDIRRPLLIGHGGKDRRVTQSESEHILQAMEAQGIPGTLVVFPDEAHGFRRHANSLAFFAVAESFLARYLGGRAEPALDAVRASSAEVRGDAELTGAVSTQP